MKENNFEGVFTAIVTPFTKNYLIDFSAFDILITKQIQAGASGIVVCGTTGESPTLKLDEKLKIIKKATINCKDKIMLIAGASSNSTTHASNLQKYLEKLDITATMHCVPWYNIPNQDGIYNHFKTISKIANKPIIMYNAPKRCGTEIKNETIIKIAKKCSNIVAIKDADTNSLKIQNYIEILKTERPNFKILGGEDSFLLPILSLGGHGIISVASNLVPKMFIELYNAFKFGQVKEAKIIAGKLSKLLKLCLLDNNPIPIKTALGSLGLISPIFRLPLYPMKIKKRRFFIKALSDLNYTNYIVENY